MVVGVGYRLLPMVLPSAMPEGRRIIASLVLVQLGVMGLFVTLLATGEAGPGWAVLSVAGIVTFLSGAVWMRRHPRRSPPARPRPGWGVAHALQALAYLLLASLLGLALVFAPTSLCDRTDRRDLRHRGAGRVPLTDRHRPGASHPPAVPVADALQGLRMCGTTTRAPHDGVADPPRRRLWTLDGRCGEFNRSMQQQPPVYQPG